MSGTIIQLNEDAMQREEALWGTRASAGTVGELNRKAHAHIDAWRERPLRGSYPHVYPDGLHLERNWGGEYENVAIFLAI